jgi:hypothetical protein
LKGVPSWAEIEIWERIERRKMECEMLGEEGVA